MDSFAGPNSSAPSPGPAYRGLAADLFIVGGAAMALVIMPSVTGDADAAFVLHGVVLEARNVAVDEEGRRCQDAEEADGDRSEGTYDNPSRCARAPCAYKR